MKPVDFGEPVRFNGNVKQRILQVLASAQGLMRKETIASRIDSTIHSVAHYLSELKKGGYIYESKGDYAITPSGRKLLEEDPFLTNIVSAKAKENGITINLPWDFIKTNPSCRAVIAARETLQQYPICDYILPFVLAWLISSGYNVPSFNDSVTETEESIAVSNILEEAYSKLIDIKNEANTEKKA